MIGRTVQESSPAWPVPPRAKDGAPNVLFFVLDDVGYGQLSCFGGLVDTPNIDRVAASGLRYANMHTTALCSPTRATHPHRPQPPLQRRRLHPGAGHRLSRATTGGCRPTNGMLAEMLVPEGYNAFCLGKWHLSPAEENTPAGPVPPLAARPRLRALLRLPRRRDQPVVSRPDAGQHADARSRRAPRTATTSARTSPTRRSRWCSTRTSTRPRSRSSCTTRPGAGHAPHHVAKEWADRYKGKFDGGWDAYRETVFAQPEADRAAARGRAALAARPRRAGVVVAVRRRAAAVRADDGGLRRLRLARRPPLRPHPGHARADRRARQHADHGHLRQRRVGRGRRHRLVQRDALLQPGAGELRGQPGAHRRPRRPVVLQPLRVGLGVGGRHAVPALEARDLPRRLDRPVRPRLAGRDGRARRDPHAVRARRSTWCRPCSTRSASQPPEAIRGVPQTPLEGVSFAHTFDDAARAVQARDAVLRDVRPPRDLPRRLARASARGRRRTSPRRRSSGASSASRSRPRSSTSSTAAAGSSTAWPTTRPSRSTSPPSTRRSCAT